MPAWLIGLILALLILGLVVKPLRKATSVLLAILIIEIVIVIIWPKTLVWFAEVALRLRGVGNLF